jgi:hypothetical protein
MIFALALSVLSLGACSPGARTVPAPQGEPPAFGGTAISASCGGGFTGGRTGVTITADDHVVRWTQATAGAQKAETDLGPNPALAADIRGRLERVRFAEIQFNEVGNMTCSLSAGDHSVSWPWGDARAPSGVVEIHGLVRTAGGGE